MEREKTRNGIRKLGENRHVDEATTVNKKRRKDREEMQRACFTYM